MKQPKNGQRTNYERSSRVPLFLPIIKFQGLKLVARAVRRGGAGNATQRYASVRRAERHVSRDGKNQNFWIDAAMTITTKGRMKVGKSGGKYVVIQ